MRILHCCFAGGYSENCAYQENRLTERHTAHGHEVMVAASDEAVKAGSYSHEGAGEFVTSDGIRVRRLTPASYVPSALRYKLRIFPGFEGILESFAPDVIFFHSLASHELLTAAKYKRSHPGTALLADSHASLDNSARGFVSMNMQHKGYYRSIYRRVRRDLDALYYIGVRERDYLTDILGISPGEISFLPLGGILADDTERDSRRADVRQSENIPDDSILLCCSGKMKEDRRPDMLLKAMELCSDPRLRLVIIGKAEGEYLDAIECAEAKDDRIRFLGWKIADTLRSFLCASDVYVLPGCVTATVQDAMCCGTPVLSYRQYTYEQQFGEGSGMMFFDTAEQLAALIEDIACDGAKLADFKRSVRSYAREHLDYERQARIIEGFGGQHDKC